MAMQQSKLHLYIFGIVGVLALIVVLLIAGFWWIFA